MIYISSLYFKFVNQEVIQKIAEKLSPTNKSLPNPRLFPLKVKRLSRTKSFNTSFVLSSQANLINPKIRDISKQLESQYEEKILELKKMMNAYENEKQMLKEQMKSEEKIQKKQINAEEMKEINSKKAEISELKIENQHIRQEILKKQEEIDKENQEYQRRKTELEQTHKEREDELLSIKQSHDNELENMQKQFEIRKQELVMEQQMLENLVAQLEKELNQEEKQSEQIKKKQILKQTFQQKEQQKKKLEQEIQQQNERNRAFDSKNKEDQEKLERLRRNKEIQEISLKNIKKQYEELTVEINQIKESNQIKMQQLNNKIEDKENELRVLVFISGNPELGGYEKIPENHKQEKSYFLQMSQTIENLESQINKLDEKKVDNAELQKQLDEITQKTNHYRKHENEQELNLKNMNDQIQQDLDQLSNHRKDLQQKIMQKTKTIKTAERKIEHLRQSTYGEELRNRMLKQEIEEIEQQKRNLKNESEFEMKNLNMKLEKIAEEEKALQQKNIEYQKSVEDLPNQLSESLKKLRGFVEKAQKVENSKLSKKQKLQFIKENQEIFQFSQGYEKQKQEIKQITSQYDDNSKQLNICLGMITQINQEISELQKHILEQKKLLENEIASYKQLKREYQTFLSQNSIFFGDVFEQTKSHLLSKLDRKQKKLQQIKYQLNLRRFQRKLKKKYFYRQKLTDKLDEIRKSSQMSLQRSESFQFALRAKELTKSLRELTQERISVQQKLIALEEKRDFLLQLKPIYKLFSARSVQIGVQAQKVEQDKLIFQSEIDRLNNFLLF
eukprot:Anaeramoba_ignava/c20607_g1_i1.p1 GENE.c20607_g1_i1~~c20607_g1_i1.p1  ORF type:complete len:789 (+),score=317.28 c20607_g1_i1:849-3215(+)